MAGKRTKKGAGQDTPEQVRRDYERRRMAAARLRPSWRTLCESLGHREVARRAEFSHGTVSHLRTGERVPEWSTIHEAERLLAEYGHEAARPNNYRTGLEDAREIVMAALEALNEVIDREPGRVPLIDDSERISKPRLED